MTIDDTERHALIDGYRQMAIDEYGETVVAPDASITMQWDGAFVRCRTGFWVWIPAVPTPATEGDTD